MTAQSAGAPIDPRMLDVARLMLEVSASEIMPRWRNLGVGDSRQKAPDDWVTIADTSAEVALRAGLGALLPGVASVGEEAAAADPSIMHLLDGSQPVLVIDPVDGTRIFKDGEEGFGSIIALVEGGLPTAGWILDCVQGTITAARRGGGVWLIGSDGAGNITASPLARPAYADTAITGSSAFFDPTTPWTGAMASRPGPGTMRLLRATCSSRDYSQLARGTTCANLAHHDYPWDHAAGVLVCTELGGIGVHLDGTAYHAGRRGAGVVAGLDQGAVDAALAVTRPVQSCNVDNQACGF